MLTLSDLQAPLFKNIKAEDKNVAIFVYTVVPIVFLALSFVPSYLGMNTTDIREYGTRTMALLGCAVVLITLLEVCKMRFKGPRWKTTLQSSKPSVHADKKWSTFHFSAKGI